MRHDMLSSQVKVSFIVILLYVGTGLGLVGFFMFLKDVSYAQ